MKDKHMGPSKHSQTGMTLLTALIFLIIFLALAAFAFRNSVGGMQSIQNMQWRAETINAADEALSQILSSPNFATNPLNFTTNFPGYRVDATGDGVADVTVTLPAVRLAPGDTPQAGPRCIRTEQIPTSALNPAVDADVACMGSSGANNSGLGTNNSSGTSTVSQYSSLCSNVEWSLTVQATDTVTNSQVNVTQGVAVRVPTTAVQTCN